MEKFANSKPVVFLGKAVDLVWMNILFLLCCLPVITIGAAWTALYYTTVKVIRRDRGSTIAREFFRSFRLNFKTGTAAWLILLCAWLLTGYGLYLIIGLRFQAYGVAAGVCSALMLMELILMIYSFAVLSRFEMRLGGLLRNALVLAVRHPGQTLFSVVVTLVIATLAVGYVQFWPLYVIFLPGCYMLALSMALEPIFALYTTKEDT